MEQSIKKLGQVFTPKHIVKQMVSMIKNKGNILEPSCGDGAFLKHLPRSTAIEYDSSKAPKEAVVIDFFDYDTKHQFDTIIGNPPYVRYSDILETTRQKLDMTLFDERSNLYLFFIYKCIQHLKDQGELIFITPREFLKATSSIKLNRYLYSKGTITDIVDLGDKKIFKGFSPNCVIFRFQKGNFSRKTNIDKNFKEIHGQLLFLDNHYTVPFSKLFFVKVGAVSGADKIFTNNKGNAEFVCSSTRTTGKLKKMFYNVNDKILLPYKDVLIQRKIKKFNEDTWYMWGRNHYISSEERIYVNCKTRKNHPFFYHQCKDYDGSILAVFPKFKTTKEELCEIIDMLNQVDWRELGFMCDGRYIFSQKSLENCMLPDSFSKFLFINNHF